jgi:hypothetical protein
MRLRARLLVRESVHILRDADFFVRAVVRRIPGLDIEDWAAVEGVQAVHR